MVDIAHCSIAKESGKKVFLFSRCKDFIRLFSKDFKVNKSQYDAFLWSADL